MKIAKFTILISCLILFNAIMCKENLRTVTKDDSNQSKFFPNFWISYSLF